MLAPRFQAVRELEKRMRRKILLSLLLLPLNLGIVQMCAAQTHGRLVEPKSHAPIPGFDRLAMDLTPDPCVALFINMHAAISQSFIRCPPTCRSSTNSPTVANTTSRDCTGF
jgi:hypothetical protein